MILTLTAVFLVLFPFRSHNSPVFVGVYCVSRLDLLSKLSGEKGNKIIKSELFQGNVMSSTTPNRYRDSNVVTTPGKNQDQHNSSFAEEHHALDAISKEANLRLQHQSEQNREARQIRYKELEKSIRDDDSSDSGSTPLTPSTPVGSGRTRIMSIDSSSNAVNGNNITSLLQKFLNGDADLRSIEQRDLRRLLSELEGKYKAAMIANSSMYNEKQALRYQVDNFKDILEEHFETLNQSKRQLKEKIKDFELQKRNLNDLQQENNQLKEILASREKLIQESGMQIIMTEQSNGNAHDDKSSSVLPIGLVSQETLSLLDSVGKGSIDEKLKNMFNERREQNELIGKLKSDFEEEKNRWKLLEKQSNKLNDSHSAINGSNDSEQLKQLQREVNDLKLRLHRFETENARLQQENKRYDAQQKTLKQQILDAERKEEQLQQERRQLQKEWRAAREDLENERIRCDVLQRENERLRTLRKKTWLNNADENLVVSTMIPRSQTNSPLPPVVSSSSSSSISVSNDPQFNLNYQDPS